MNYFIVNQKDRMIWADMDCPIMPKSEKYYSCGTFAQEAFNSDMYHYDCNLEIYNSRPHYPYSTELNWIDGQRVEEEKDFELLPPCECHPMCKHPFAKGACKQRNQGQSLAIPLSSKDKEEKTERATASILPEGDGLIKFLDENIKLSKEDKDGHRMFMAGWIAAFSHVKVNYAERISAPQPPLTPDWRKELSGYLGYTSFEQLDTAERSIAEWMEKYFQK